MPPHTCTHGTRPTTVPFHNFFCCPPFSISCVLLLFAPFVLLHSHFSTTVKSREKEREKKGRNLNSKNNVIYGIVMCDDLYLFIFIYFNFWFFGVYERSYSTRSMWSLCGVHTHTAYSNLFHLTLHIVIYLFGRCFCSLFLFYFVHYEFRIWLLKKFILTLSVAEIYNVSVLLLFRNSVLVWTPERCKYIYKVTIIRGRARTTYMDVAFQ